MAVVEEAVAGMKATPESLRPKSGGRINRGQLPAEDDQAEHDRLYEKRMAQMKADGLLINPDQEIATETDLEAESKANKTPSDTEQQ